MTRKIAFTFAIVAAFMSVKAQDKSDVLRYSQTTPGGSTRAQAIGGATGSIGGDYSSIFSNPAGVGFFKTSEFALGFNYQQSNTKSTYLGTAAADQKGSFNINSAALIFAGTKHNPDSKWQNVTVGLGYNRLANFNENIYYRGRNTTSSIGSQYVSRLAGVDSANVYDPANSFGPLEAASTGFVLENVNGSGQLNGTWSTISPYDRGPKGVLQENSIYATGRSEIYTVAVGANYADKFYFGGNLNFPHIQYDRTSTFRETNTEGYSYTVPGYSPATLKYFEASNYLHTSGNGFGANLGVIYRPIPALRVGATFVSPMWITFLDDYSGVYTNSDDLGIKSYYTDDDYNGPAESRYTIRTPWKGIISAAYVFTPKGNNIRKPSGFLTVDYEYEDYASSNLHFSNDAANSQQETANAKADIKNSFQGASNIHVGGEIKLDVFALRAGYAYYGNPYSSSNLDGTRKYYSGGLGYRNKGFYMDLTYVYSDHSVQDQPYVVGTDQPDTPTPAPANIKVNASNVSLAFGFKF